MERGRNKKHLYYLGKTKQNKTKTPENSDYYPQISI